MGSGVKQGCPLSPTLFIIAAEAILRYLKAHMATGDHISGYADDLAIIMRDFWRSAPAIATAFHSVGIFSGLCLKPSKCIFIPLWHSPSARLRYLLREMVPVWGDFTISTAAKYLGIWVGPGSMDKSWDSMLHKYNQRVEVITSMGLGHFLSAMAYRVLAVSCLGYGIFNISNC